VVVEDDDRASDRECFGDLVGLAGGEMLDLILSEILSSFLDYLAFFYD